MEIRPVAYAGRPKYPKKNEIDTEGVKRSIPKRWASSPAAKIALGTLAVVSLAGCVPDLPTGTPMATVMITEQTASPEETLYPGVPMAPVVNVAPLFVHGEGRGAFGGRMASVPAFLSEDEALEVINEAALSYGLEFSSADGAEFSNVLQPVTDLNPPAEDGENLMPADTFITLKPDFSDSEHGIVIEFITKDDVVAWSRGPSASTLEIYDTKGAAAQLSESLENAVPNGFYTTAVLYDPCEASKSTDKNSLSEEQLKKQATDFFEWLKSQGII